MKSSKNVGYNGLWGELPPREPDKQEIVPPDVIDNIWRQVMEESNNTDSDYTTQRQPEFIQLPMGNVHVLNTIHLRQQLRAMEEGTIIKNLTVIEDESQDDSFKDSSDCTLPNKQSRKNFKNNGNISHLRPATARSILNHAVITLLAHVGFEKAWSHAIDTLTDVAEHFLERISLLLKTASEEKNYGFPDALEKVFVEANIGGIIGVHSYYQDYVLRHEKNVRRDVEKKMEQQKKLEFDSCNIKMDTDEGPSSMHFDELSQFSNVYRKVPTLQLLDPDMGFPPSLDAGFQMLHSLEQDELNSLEVEEEQDANASSSPITLTQQRTDFQ
ncbi:uncharacterized protein LOC106641314 [Copidosoma floridanum]|uniref:uncharacterized protein LOC106641314 n=1 Tax=Copidosoma floridanum TaxID=29053 RepID=UPI0006C9DE7C|nr:uncharacterized protein LOC106641314 [Copidosoma floridanum]XP_014211189.1 uncharacterized protein LOC106641314 [Copidosoma floridanum]